MHEMYWMATVVAMMQLSHFVFDRCCSSCKSQRVDATELLKHRQTSTPRQKFGHLDSPQRPEHGKYPAQHR